MIIDNEEDKEFLIEEDPELESYLKRNFNALKEEQNIVRKQAIMNIYQRLRDQKFEISGAISQIILVKFTKDLLLSMSDSIEKVREYAILSLKEILSRCEDMEAVLPYIFTVICQRTNCHDLEGILQMPEVMRPPPDQKPKVLIALVEPSEELRLQIVQLLQIILSCNNSDTLRNHLDEAVNALRALCMDPFGEVQREACQCLSEFCRNNHEILLHFTETLARSLLFPLISKKSRVKIAALEALGSVLECGIWKHNAVVLEVLTGFRDPNSVPIKAFYEPMTNINYLATFIIDPKQQVREMFVACVGDWLTRLADRWDHHARLMPYIVSGLFDESEDVRSISMDTIEQVGIQWEVEREKDIKEARQLGIDAPWTSDGRLCDLPLPHPFTKRPRIGARGFVKSQVRKMWPALFRELQDINEEHRYRASNLMLMGIIYSEETMTQFLDQFIPNTITSLCCKEGDSKTLQKTADKVKESYRYLGRFCDFKSYLPMIFTSVRGQYRKDEWYMKCSMEALNQLLQGALEATLREEGIGSKVQFLTSVIDLLNEKDQIEFISQLNIEQAQNLLSTIINSSIKYAREQEYISFFKSRVQSILTILGVLQYIRQFGQTMILNLPLDQNNLNQTITNISNKQPMQLRSTLFSLLDLKVDLLEKQQNIMSNLGDLIYLNSSWKNIVSDMTCAIIENSDFSYFKIIIRDFIKQVNIPEIVDFLLKYVYVTLSYVKVLTQPIFSLLIEFTAECLSWLEQSTQKYASNMIKFFFNQIQKLYKTILLFSSKEKFQNQWKSIAQDLGTLQQFTSLTKALTLLHKKYFKAHYNEVILMVHSITHRCLPYPSAKHLQYEGQFLIPIFLSYTLDQIDILGDNPKQETRFRLLEMLNLVIQYIPNSMDTSFYSGEACTIPEYQKFITKLIRFTLEEKDLQGREKYIVLLQSLKNKTPHNFYIEMEQAKYGNQLSRVELLSKFVQ